MKKLLVGILTITSLSSHANVYGTSFQDLNSITTCSEAYSEAANKTSKPWGKLQAADEYTAAFGMPGALVIGIAVGTPLVLLVPLAYAGISQLTQNKYEGFFKGKQLYQAGQQCLDTGVCEDKNSYDLNLLGDVQKYLKKKKVEISREEISDFVLTQGQDLDFCTKKIKKNGVRVLKSFKSLKKEILKGLKS